MYFMAVYEQGGFTSAAGKAGVVQPALSMQVRNLEEELNVVLFLRTPRGVIPTDFGKTLYELCLPIRTGVAKAKQQMLELGGREKVFGTVRCGFPPTFFKKNLALALAGYTTRHPNVELVIREAYGGTLNDWVSAGDLDFALGAWTETDTALAHQTILEEDLVLVCGKAIAGQNFSSCDLTQIDGLKLMIPSANQVLGPLLRHYISNRMIRPEQTMVMDSYLGILEMARVSDWAGLVPISGVLDEQDGSLFLYAVSYPSISFRWHLLHLRGRVLSSAAAILIDLVSEQLSETRQEWRALWKCRCLGKSDAGTVT